MQSVPSTDITKPLPPVDSIIDLNGKPFNRDRLMEVILKDRKILMFTDDLKAGTISA